jgi:two-component system, OmpR family, phosphate regulon response regulator PhoB
MNISYAAMNDSAPPHLTPTEARLLEVLRSRPGHVFDRGLLVELVMPNTIVLERTIDVHIRSLRAKLGNAARTIRTVRQRGYCFQPDDA